MKLAKRRRVDDIGELEQAIEKALPKIVKKGC